MKLKALITCLGLAALASSGLAWASVADSVSDFSNVQGQNNWYYGYLPTPGQPGSFVQAPVIKDTFILSASGSLISSPTWQESSSNPPWVLLWDQGQHASGTNSGAEHWADRRWVSASEGVFDISGTIGRLDNGDTTARIYINGVQQYVFDTASLAVLGHTNYILTSVLLGAGDAVDFVVDPNGQDFSDSTFFTAHIATVPVPAGAWLFGSALAGLGFFNKPHRRTKPDEWSA